MQTHLEADYQPLRDGEVVYVEVGLNPSSAVIRLGCRLSVDIQPYSPAGIPSRAYDESYHTGATNTIYTGPNHPSYVQLPIVPQNQPTPRETLQSSAVNGTESRRGLFRNVQPPKVFRRH